MSADFRIEWYSGLSWNASLTTDKTSSRMMCNFNDRIRPSRYRSENQVFHAHTAWWHCDWQTCAMGVAQTLMPKVAVAHRARN
eukprot:2076503-Amphidinium_carterae.1